MTAITPSWLAGWMWCVDGTMSGCLEIHFGDSLHPTEFGFRGHSPITNYAYVIQPERLRFCIRWVTAQGVILLYHRRTFRRRRVVILLSGEVGTRVLCRIINSQSVSSVGNSSSSPPHFASFLRIPPGPRSSLLLSLRVSHLSFISTLLSKRRKQRCLLLVSVFDSFRTRVRPSAMRPPHSVDQLDASRAPRLLLRRRSSPRALFQSYGTVRWA